MAIDVFIRLDDQGLKQSELSLMRGFTIGLGQSLPEPFFYYNFRPTKFEHCWGLCGTRYYTPAFISTPVRQEKSARWLKKLITRLKAELRTYDKQPPLIQMRSGVTKFRSKLLGRCIHNLSLNLLSKSVESFLEPRFHQLSIGYGKNEILSGPKAERIPRIIQKPNRLKPQTDRTSISARSSTAYRSGKGSYISAGHGVSIQTPHKICQWKSLPIAA
ncbi:MAG: hypothetical protein AAFZ99_14505 [Pseudomonadota bacterium]